MNQDRIYSTYSLTILLQERGVTTDFIILDWEAEEEFIRQAHESKSFFKRRGSEDNEPDLALEPVVS